MNHLNLTKLACLLKMPMIIGGIALASLQVQNAHAQCGYAAGLGCPNTDYTNFGYNSNNDAATIEYDNYIGAFHSTIVRSFDGTFAIWGEYIQPNPSGNYGDNNGNYTRVVYIKPGQGAFADMDGTPIKAAIGSNREKNVQAFVITSNNKIWVWGTQGESASGQDRNAVVTSGTGGWVTQRSGSTNVIPLQSKSLPSGVSAADVKQFTATAKTLSILTCSGDVYILSQQAQMRGRGSSSTNATTWYKVKKDASNDLSNIIALRVAPNAAFALDANGDLWTWGTYTYDGQTGTDHGRAARAYATKMTLPTPAEGNPGIKMIATTGTISYTGNQSKNLVAYYVLYNNGELFSLGDGFHGILGDWGTADRPEWVTPKYENANNPGNAGEPMRNIKWISASDHDGGYAFINVINEDKEIYNWGQESGSHLGRGVQSSTTNSTGVNPGQPAFQSGAKEVVAVESGGHTTMISAICEQNFGYVGHLVRGSMATGNNSTSQVNEFTFETDYVQACGVTTVPVVEISGDLIKGPGGDFCNNQTITLKGTPAGGTFSVTATGASISNGNQLTYDGPVPSSVTVTYTLPASECTQNTATIDLAFEGCGDPYKLSGIVWIDDNEDATKDSGEQGTNLDDGSRQLWANLVDTNGDVVQSVPVANDGSYSLSTFEDGIYSVQITNQKIGMGPIPGYANDLPYNWEFTGTNKGGSTPCTAPGCTNIISDIALGFNNPNIQNMNFGVKGGYTVSGTVYHDADGLNGSSKIVDGTPIYGSSSEYENQSQPQLYINVLDTNGKIIHFVPVANDGTYSVDIPLRNNVRLQLTTTPPVIGETATAPVLPEGWVYAGESFGTGNNSGSGMNDGSGTGNNAPATRYDGFVHVSFPGATDQVTNVDFGIQQPPVADAKAYEVQNNAFSRTAPAGFPPTDLDFAFNIPMSSGDLVETTSNLNGSLSGSDPEDCLNSSCNGNGETGDVNATFNITAVNANTRLYYDFGTQAGGIQQVIPGTATGTIENFDASKMVIYAKDGTGQADDELGFSYSITDRAGATSEPVTYKIQTVFSLPLVLTDFSGYAKEGASIIGWETVKEENLSHFNLLRSADGKQWAKIAEVKAANKPSLVNNYTYSDNEPNGGNNFYKLEIAELDGSFSHSKVINIIHKLLNKGVSLYPNPADEFINLTIHHISENETVNVVVMDASGAVKQNTDYTGNSNIVIDMNKLSSGVYHIQITRGKEIFTHKVIKR